jgi:Bifunctional DNA primase/polymerase, N-terminal
MRDRYPDASRYKAQGFWPIPCEPGSKRAAVKWTVFQHRAMTTTEMHDAWPRDGDANIALVLGPAAHLLVLNVNMKHGDNGLQTLNGYPLPTTPTILTPHDGLAYCFSVPDRRRYPFGFKTHNVVPQFPGIELRGTGGYQLVPSSHVTATARDPAGDYRLAADWKLERLMISLAPPPDWLLELWIATDRREQNFADDEPENIGKARKRPSAAVRTTDLTPKHPRRSQARPAPTAHPPKQELLKSGARYLARAHTTVLSAENGRRFRGTFAYGCALHLVRLLGQPGVWVENKHTFLCLLPGHRESTPSARWVWQEDGSLLYHDMHVRSEQRKPRQNIIYLRGE